MQSAKNKAVEMVEKHLGRKMDINKKVGIRTKNYLIKIVAILLKNTKENNLFGLLFWKNVKKELEQL